VQRDEQPRVRRPHGLHGELLRDRGAHCSSDDLDIVFVLDASASVTAARFPSLLTFAENIVNRVDVANGAHVATVVFNGLGARVELNLTDARNNSDAVQRLRAIPYPNNGNSTSTLTATGLQVAANQVSSALCTTRVKIFDGVFDRASATPVHILFSLR
jgi:Mg-chelatase subunit ChlD